MRSGEGTSTDSTMPKAYRLQSLTTRARMRSPGAVPGTKTASPSQWPTPLPSPDSRSMGSVMIWFFCKGMVPPWAHGVSGGSDAAAVPACSAARYLLGGTPLARLKTREK